MGPVFKDLKPSQRVVRCRNDMFGLIRELHAASAAGACGKSLISLSIGDPAIDGNFPAPPSLTASLIDCAESTRCNNYSAGCGFPSACAAVAKYWTEHFMLNKKKTIPANHVVLSSGSSDALSMCIGAICGEGDNILLPAPYFALYGMICRYYNVEVRFYRCNHEKDWEIDFNHLRSLVDGKTKAILINNPSNPCGSNFSRKHVEDLIHLCEELKLPLIADEIYAGVVFSGETFTSVAEFETPVPLFVVSGISKRFNVPGYRFGWVIVIDRDGYGAKLLKAIKQMSTRCIIPNSIIQHATVKFLSETPKSYFEDCAKRLEEGAMTLFNALQNCPGLRVIRPRGSMFMSVVLNFKELESNIPTDAQFAIKLAEEENVHVFPGEPFKMPGALRLTVSRPLPMLTEAATRLRAFCERHAKLSQ